MFFWRFLKKLTKFILCFLLLFFIAIGIMGVIGYYDCSIDVKPISTEVNDGPTPDFIAKKQNEIKGYKRPLTSTFLTIPEWYIVYSSREYANFLKENRPSGFPYYSSIKQYWCLYHTVNTLTENYQLNTDNHIMLMVIGVSFTAEYIVKAVYENTIGRVTEWLSADDPTAEDIYAQKVAKEYVEFIPKRPWFEFNFAKSLKELWTNVDWYGPNMLRKWDRKIALSMEYSVKAIYGWLIGLGSHATLGAASNYIYAAIDAPSNSIFKAANVKVESDVTGNIFIVAIQHEQPFTDSVESLAPANPKFIDIAGNKVIMLTALVPVDWEYTYKNGEVLYTMPVLTEPQLKRVAILVPVSELINVTNKLNKSDIRIEHIHDF